MAIADAIGALFSAQFQEVLYQDNPWPTLVNDVSGELPYGDQLIMVSSDYDRTAGLDESLTRANVQSTVLASHTWPAPVITDTSEVTLTIDKYPRLSELIPKIPARQIRPGLVAEKAGQAAIKMRETVNKDIYDVVNAKTADDTIDVSAANFAAGQAAFQTALFDAFADASEAQDDLYIPMEGRLCVVSPAIYRNLVDKLVAEKLFLVQGATDAAAIRNELPMYRGYTIMRDNSRGSGKTNTDDAKHSLVFMRRGEGASYAGQIRDMRTLDSEAYNGYWTQAQYAYGTILNQPSRIRVVKLNIT